MTPATVYILEETRSRGCYVGGDAPPRESERKTNQRRESSRCSFSLYHRHVENLPPRLSLTRAWARANPGNLILSKYQMSKVCRCVYVCVCVSEYKMLSSTAIAIASIRFFLRSLSPVSFSTHILPSDLSLYRSA